MNSDKLQRIEEIEKWIGVDIPTLYRALSRGIYYRDKDKIFFTGCSIIWVGKHLVQVKPCYQVKEVTLESCYFGFDTEEPKQVKDAHYWSWETSLQWQIMDYGKTWALTREELENEK